MAFLSARDGEGQERDVARPLDRDSHLALVTRAVPADAAGDDLAALADEVLQRLRVLVVDDRGLVRAVLADALLAAATPAGGVGVQVRCPAEVLVVVHRVAHAVHDGSSSSAAGLPAAAAGAPAGVLSGASSSANSGSRSSPGSRRIRRGSSWMSRRPRARSRDSCSSASGESSRRWYFTSSGSLWPVSSSTCSFVSTV